MTAGDGSNVEGGADTEAIAKALSNLAGAKVAQRDPDAFDATVKDYKKYLEKHPEEKEKFNSGK